MSIKFNGSGALPGVMLRAFSAWSYRAPLSKSHLESGGHDDREEMVVTVCGDARIHVVGRPAGAPERTSERPWMLEQAQSCPGLPVQPVGRPDHIDHRADDGFPVGVGGQADLHDRGWQAAVERKLEPAADLHSPATLGPNVFLQQSRDIQIHETKYTNPSQRKQQIF